MPEVGFPVEIAGSVPVVAAPVEDQMIPNFASLDEALTQAPTAPLGHAGPLTPLSFSVT